MLTRSHQQQSSNPFIFMWPLQSPQPGKYLPPLAWPRARGWTEVFGVECYSPCELGACHAVRRHPAPGLMAKLCHGNPAARREGLGGSRWVKAIKLLLWSWFEEGSFPLPWHHLFPARQSSQLAGRCHLSHTCLTLRPPRFLQGQKKKQRENQMVLHPGLPSNGGFEPGASHGASPSLPVPACPFP